MNIAVSGQEKKSRPLGQDVASGTKPQVSARPMPSDVLRARAQASARKNMSGAAAGNSQTVTQEAVGDIRRAAAATMKPKNRVTTVTSKSKTAVSLMPKPVTAADVRNNQTLREYVMLDEPAPLNLESSANAAKLEVERKRHKKKVIIVTIVAAVLLVVCGAGGWWYWHNKNAEIAENDELQEDLIEEVNTAQALSLDDGKVRQAYDYLEKVVYVEPFLKFYPIGELTIDDLSDAQYAALIGSDERIVGQSDEKYVHSLYMAEMDEDELYLYEYVLIARPRECDFGEETCLDYYRLSGARIDIQGTDFPEEQIWNYMSESDQYKWTFARNSSGEYTFVKVSRADYSKQK